MTKRLKYERYDNSKDVIEIDLNNGYVVIAIYGFNIEEDCYSLNLFIKDKQILNWKPIEDIEDIKINTDSKTINSAILKHIALLFNDGFFDKYIERYEYETKCFDRGNELFEMERLGVNNV